MSNTSKLRPAVAYRSKAEAVASWNTPPVKSPTSPCTFMSPVPSPKRSRRPSSSARTYSPAFEKTTNASKLIHLPNAWNHTLMATALTLIATSTHTVVTAATTSPVTTATHNPTHTTLHTLQLLHQVPPQRPPQHPLIRQPPTIMRSTMPISQAVIHMLRTEGTLVTWLTTSSTTSKLNKLHRLHQVRALTSLTRRRRHPQACELVKVTHHLNEPVIARKYQLGTDSISIRIKLQWSCFVCLAMLT
jgi:hypothetical protein